MENEPSKVCLACGSWWRLPLLLGLVLTAIMWSRVHSLHEETSDKKIDQSAPITNSVPQEKVTLSIDFGDSRQKNFDAIPWRSGMTVADAMKAALGVTVAHKGSGQSTFVTAIDGIENQGADGQNWMYKINGKIADRSFAVYELKPGDRILWTFRPWQ